MKIQKEKLIKLIAASTFGTGTLAEAAEVHPDEIQKLIGREEGEEVLIERLEGLLGGSFRLSESSSKSDRPLLNKVFVHNHTIAELKTLVDKKEIDPVELLRIESLFQNPRKTLIEWLENVVPQEANTNGDCSTSN